MVGVGVVRERQTSGITSGYWLGDWVDNMPSQRQYINIRKEVCVETSSKGIGAASQYEVPAKHSTGTI